MVQFCKIDCINTYKIKSSGKSSIVLWVSGAGYNRIQGFSNSECGINKIKKKQDAGSFDFVLKVIIILERVRVNLLCEELQADFLNQQRYVTEEIISALH